MQWEELPPVFMTSAEGRTGREEALRYIDTVHQSITLICMVNKRGLNFYPSFRAQ